MYYTPSISVHCTHQRLYDGIHIFRFEQTSRRSVDEFLLHMDSAYRALPEGEPMRIVIDYKLRGIPHLSYGVQRLRQWISDNPQTTSTNVAFIHNNHALAAIIDAVTRLMRIRRAHIRFFHENQQDNAFNWLQSL